MATDISHSVPPAKTSDLDIDEQHSYPEKEPSMDSTPVISQSSTPTRSTLSLFYPLISLLFLALLGVYVYTTSEPSIMNPYDSQHVFDQLHAFQTTRNGSILADIGSLLGQAIHSVASGGSQITKALGAGIRDIFHGVFHLNETVVGSISNATATVITAGASGISKILSAIGGPSGIILYILVIGLYVYIVYSRVRQDSALTLHVGYIHRPGRGDSPDFSGNRTPPQSPFLEQKKPTYLQRTKQTDHYGHTSPHGRYRDTTKEKIGLEPLAETSSRSGIVRYPGDIL